MVGHWSIAPGPSGQGSLNAVSCTSSRVCVAVGGRDAGTNGLQPLAESWDGDRWATQATRVLTGPRTLCQQCRAAPTSPARPSVAIAVRRWRNGGTGSIGSIQATPYAGQLYTGGLAGVSCPSSTTCLAVAATIGQGDGIRTLALRWDGGTCTRESTPSAPDNDYNGGSLNAIACTSTVICTAVGWGDRWYTGLAEQRAAAASNRFTVSGIRTFTDGTVRLRIAVPGPGSIDVLETAWNDNLAHAASLLLPAAKRFVFAHENLQAGRAGTITIKVPPNTRGRQLVVHHRYRVVLRLWVAHTPVNGRPRQAGLPGLHLPRGRR